MSIRLGQAALPRFGDSVSTPAYARDDLSAGIVHFGVGNFFRAHMALYLDRLFDKGEDLDWAILGAGVMPGDAKMRDALASQDFLSTVVEQSADARQARVEGSVIGFVAPGDAPAILARLADPAIRIVSLTVTEGGYFVDADLGGFNAQHPAIQADAAAPEAPKTVFGLIVAALKARRAAGEKPFTVMSCDNLPGNGHAAQEAVVGLARLSDPDLADWIADEVAFPNGMVDRITPATSEREKTLLAEEFGIEDAWPVFCEDFTQWVLEDRFSNGRPALEKVGVTFTDDVVPYEHMKLRILNGGHAAIAYPSGLMGIHFVHEAMENPLVDRFLAKLEHDEIIPMVPPVPDTDLTAYFDTVVRRLRNPRIGDTIRRLCLDGSNRQPKFIVPTLIDRLRAGLPVTGLALESALWCRYCFGVDERGADIAPNDPAWDMLQSRAREARGDPSAWLSMGEVYGAAAHAAPFREAFGRALDALWSEGTEATLTRYLSDGL